MMIVRTRDNSNTNCQKLISIPLSVWSITIELRFVKNDTNWLPTIHWMTSKYWHQPKFSSSSLTTGVVMINKNNTGLLIIAQTFQIIFSSWNSFKGFNFWASCFHAILLIPRLLCVTKLTWSWEDDEVVSSWSSLIESWAADWTADKICSYSWSWRK